MAPRMVVEPQPVPHNTESLSQYASQEGGARPACGRRAGGPTSGAAEVGRRMSVALYAQFAVFAFLFEICSILCFLYVFATF